MGVLLTKADLHHYQRFSADFICANPQSAILLDCGLGKTVTTLTALDELLFDSFYSSGIDKFLLAFYCGNNFVDEI